jgi:hypothetical protein
VDENFTPKVWEVGSGDALLAGTVFVKRLTVDCECAVPLISSAGGRSIINQRRRGLMRVVADNDRGVLERRSVDLILGGTKEIHEPSVEATHLIICRIPNERYLRQPASNASANA